MNPVVHRGPDGRVQAVRAASYRLFTVAPCAEEDLRATVLQALKTWVADNLSLYGWPPDSQPRLQHLTLGDLPSYVRGDLRLLRFEQTYRGLEIYGRSSRLTVAISGMTDVRYVSGAIIDQACEYSGLDDSLSSDEAADAIERHWRERFPGEEVTVRDVRRLAVPEQESIAFSGEIGQRVFASSRIIVGVVVIEAATGELVALEDRRHEAIVNGLELTDNPRTQTQAVFEDQPSTRFGNTIHFEPNPALDCVPWLDFKLGDDLRFTVLDFKGSSGTDTDVAPVTVGVCASGSPPPNFSSGPSDADRFVAQDIYVKTRRALDAIDPLMGELITHGTTHPYSWSHHPDVPDIAHRSPLVAVINDDGTIGEGAIGVYMGAWLSESDSEGLGLPNPHPLVYVCRNAQGDVVPCGDAGAVSKEQFGNFVFVRSPRPFHTRTLFHEIGHYYDGFNTHGVLNGAIREIVAQLICLYLHRKLYPTLTYTLPTMPAGSTCSLAELISHSAGSVVHPDCVASVDDVAQSIVVTNNGYGVMAFTQAFWSLLYGVQTAIVGNTVEADEPDALPEAYEDRWLEALLFALQVSNEQAYGELWDNMELFIDVNYPGDLALIQSARELHGLE